MLFRLTGTLYFRLTRVPVCSLHLLHTTFLNNLSKFSASVYHHFNTFLGVWKCDETLSFMFEILLLKLIIIRQVKTKKIITVKEVWIPGLTSIDFHDFVSHLTT